MSLQKENKFKKMILSGFSKVAMVVAIGCAIYSFPGIYTLYDINKTSDVQTNIVASAINPEYTENTEENNMQTNITEINEETNKYDFQKLRETNPNIVAVIEGSCFDGGYYPIVSTNSSEEGDYYLNHSVDNAKSSLGTLFFDYNNTLNDQVVRIWGHNFHNNGSQMFTKLADICQDQSLYDKTLGQDHSLKLYTETGEYDLDVAACVVNDPRTQSVGNYGDQNQFLNDMQKIENSSKIQTNTQIETNDQVIILTTCTDLGSAKDPNNRVSVYCKATPQKVYQPNQGKHM